GAVAASDAFFPFADGLQVLLDAGVSAVVAPGGSVRDEEAVAAAADAGIAMYFAGTRHFAHCRGTAPRARPAAPLRLRRGHLGPVADERGDLLGALGPRPGGGLQLRLRAGAPPRRGPVLRAPPPRAREDRLDPVGRTAEVVAVPRRRRGRLL